MTEHAVDTPSANDVLTFWFEATKPSQWYRRDHAFDREIENHFSKLHDAAANGTLDTWQSEPQSALARIIILDQFSRNIFRDDPRAFAVDDLALAAARDAITRDFDLQFPEQQQAFFLMPFMHAETLSVQKESVQHFTNRQPGRSNLSYAIEHHDIIEKFGRFPHRNKILGRQSTPEEIQYLETGGFNP